MEVFPIFLLVSASLFLLNGYCYKIPATQTNNKVEQQNAEDNETGGLEEYNMEYHRYLKEVGEALDSDPDFRTKVQKTDIKDIESGKIAEELEFVNHSVRTRLDEIKRVELERLKKLTDQKIKLAQGIDDELPIHEHLNHVNPHTFEIDDLKKLIAKTLDDMTEVDKKRRDEFKQYEMQKEYDKQMKINHTEDEEQRIKLEKEYKEREEKHKKHEKLHQPGRKAQLEEVWQEQDQMQQEFDPKTFFMLHDVDGNGLWDQNEVKALFISELEKMYDPEAPEDDWRERNEEMERMRESAYEKFDLNRDGFIDFQEFSVATKKEDFTQDEGWQGLDETKPYTDDELYAYIEQHLKEAFQLDQSDPVEGEAGGHPQQLSNLQGEVNTNEDYPQQFQQSQGGYQQPSSQGNHSRQGYQQKAQSDQGLAQPNQQELPGANQKLLPQGYQHQQRRQDYQQQPSLGYQQQPSQGSQQQPFQGYQQQPSLGYQQFPRGNEQQLPRDSQEQPSQSYQQQPPQNNQKQLPQGYQQQPGQNYQQQLPQEYDQQPRQNYQQQPANGNEQQPLQGYQQQQISNGNEEGYQQQPRQDYQQQPRQDYQQQPSLSYQQQPPQGSQQQPPQFSNDKEQRLPQGYQQQPLQNNQKQLPQGFQQQPRQDYQQQPANGNEQQPLQGYQQQQLSNGNKEGYQQQPRQDYQQQPSLSYQQQPPQGSQQQPPQFSNDKEQRLPQGYQQQPLQNNQKQLPQGFQQQPRQDYQQQPRQDYRQQPPQGYQQQPLQD